MKEINDLIRKKLAEKNIEITGNSKYRDDLEKFSYNPVWLGLTTSQRLFSFLLENLMNRYLFNLMLRKTPNIDSWPLNDKDFNEDQLKKSTFNESFIRIYNCYNCKHLLKRIYAPELYIISNDVLECPKCGLKKMVYPNYYESTFSIIKNDLVNFIKKLRDIEIIHSREYIFCPSCELELGAKDELSSIKNCSICGKIINGITRRDEFKDSFLKICQSEPGLWFEWFIYEIVKYVYKNVEYGLNLSYTDKDGINKEKEIDIVALNDNTLILIECKNYLDHTPPSQYETIIDIASFFDEVYIINFYKPHKDVNKKIIKSPNIKIFNGDEIDNKFLNPELIIFQLLHGDTSFGNQIFTRISIGKKIAVLVHIIKNFNDDTRKALFNILFSKSIDEELFWNNFKKPIEDILKSELVIISSSKKSVASGIDISNNLNLVSAYYFFFDSKKLLEVINPIKILDSIVGINKLSDNYDSLMRTILNRMFDIYDINDFNLSLIENKLIFDLILDDLIYSYRKNYPSWSQRNETLRWINFIFEKISDKKINDFCQLLESEFKNSSFHSGTVADSMYRIFSKYKHRFEKTNEDIIYNSAKYLYENGINNWVKDSANLFITNIETKISSLPPSI